MSWRIAATTGAQGVRACNPLSSKPTPLFLVDVFDRAGLLLFADRQKYSSNKKVAKTEHP
jgi:hypothetical protein